MELNLLCSLVNLRVNAWVPSWRHASGNLPSTCSENGLSSLVCIGSTITEKYWVFAFSCSSCQDLFMGHHQLQSNLPLSSCLTSCYGSAQGDCVCLRSAVCILGTGHWPLAMLRVKFQKTPVQKIAKAVSVSQYHGAFAHDVRKGVQN